ncbi:MAG: flippase [Nanoarchaeota archaeon]
MAKKLSNELKVILASASIAFFGSIVNRVFNYVLRILIARGLSVEDYGLFTIAIMVMRFTIAISLLGLGEGLVRYVSYYRGLKDESKIKGTIFSSFGISFLFSLVITIILFFSAEFIAVNWFNSQELIPLLKIFVWAIPIGVIGSNLTSLNLAFEKIKYNFWLVDFGSQSLRVLTIGLVILLGLGIIGVGFAYLISFWFIIIVMYLVAESKVFPILRSKVKSEYNLKELFSYSWPLIFVGVLGYVMGWTDTFMIANLTNITNVGLYNAALPLANLLTLLPLMFSPLFLPLITKNYAKKKMELVSSLTKNVGKWSYMVNFPVLLLMLLFPGLFINILFGVDYLSATNALIYLAIGFFFFSLSYPSMHLLGMIKKTKLSLINLLIVIPINVILNYYLIIDYGITGVAIATAISYIIYSLLFILEGYYYLKLVPISFRFWKATLAGLISLGMILFIRNLIEVNLGFAILLGIMFSIIYLGLLFLFKAFDEYDKMLVGFLRTKFLKR